jgi:hypothetical protein
MRNEKFVYIEKPFVFFAPGAPVMRFKDEE